MKKLMTLNMLKKQKIDFDKNSILGRGVTSIAFDNNNNTVTIYTIDPKKFYYFKNLEKTSGINLNLKELKSYKDFNSFSMKKLIKHSLKKKEFSKLLFEITDLMFEYSYEFSLTYIEDLIPFLASKSPEEVFKIDSSECNKALSKAMIDTFKALIDVIEVGTDEMDLHPNQFLQDDKGNLLCIDPIINKDVLDLSRR